MCGGRCRVLKYLVEIGADINQKDFDGDTPLMCSMTPQGEPIAKFLIEAGADIFAQNELLEVRGVPLSIR